MIYTEQDLIELSKQDLQHSRALRRSQYPEASRYLQSKLDPIGENLERLGSDYGGWVFSPSLFIGNAERTFSVLAGAGEDLSFDLELNRRYGTEIVIIDPTPRALTHYKNLRKAFANGQQFPINESEETYEFENVSFEKIDFLPYALWKESKEMRFYQPATSSSVSHSLTNIQKTEHYIIVESKTLREVLTEIGRDRINILKLDIEGAEIEVCSSLSELNVLPKQLLIEFDELQMPDENTHGRIRSAMQTLRELGYRLEHIEGRQNCLFILT